VPLSMRCVPAGKLARTIDQVCPSVSFLSPLPHAGRAHLLRALSPVSVAVVALCAFGQAQAASTSLEPVVITATRSDQPLPDALPSTRVIDRAEIEALQVHDVAAVLRSLTSIDVAQSGPTGSATSLFLRGADSRQVLVLVDGIAINRADFGSASWQYLALDQVERIEVVRGNGSSVWGAQAVGGVVNLITRQASQPALSLTLGSLGQVAASGAIGSRWGEGGSAGRVSLALSTRRSDGFDAKTTSGHNPDRDGSRQDAASVRLEQGWAAGHRSSVSLVSSDNHSEYDNTAGHDELHTRQQGIGLNSRHALATGLELGVDLGETHERFEDPTGPQNFGNSWGRNRVRQGQAQLQWDLESGHRLLGGIETRRERASDSSTSVTERQTDSVRLGWLGRYPVGGQALEVQTHLRRDDSDRFGSADTGLLGLAWLWNEQWKTSLQLSTGFSLPSFLDSQFAAPGVSLRPERSRNAELALHWQQADRSARLAWFSQMQRDRIGFDASLNSSVNIDRAANHGVELIAQAPLGAGKLGFEYTGQHAFNRDTGRLLARRSREALALNYRLSQGAWDGAAWLRHVGQRLDSDFSNAVSPARTTLDLTTGWRLSQQWRIGARLENVAGIKVPEVVGYTAAPRSFALTLQGSL
jgi:vitamin B12 transporter